MSPLTLDSQADYPQRFPDAEMALRMINDWQEGCRMGLPANRSPSVTLFPRYNRVADDHRLAGRRMGLPAYRPKHDF